MMRMNQLMSRALLRGWVLLCVVLFAGTSCSDNDNDSPVGEGTSVYAEGEEIVSEFLVNDAVVEKLEEEVVNLGNKEMPALFFIRKSHTFEGQQLEDGSSSYNGFRSLRREKLEKFILAWGKVIGITITTDDTAENKLNKAKAFWLLASYLRENEIEPAVLVKLAERKDEDVSALAKLIDESRMVSMRGNSTSVGPNELLLALEKSETTAKTLIATIESQGETVQSFFQHCDRSGINFPATLANNTTRGSISAIIKGVVKGIEFASKIIIFFVENGAPSVNIQNQYVQFLHVDDIDYTNYITGERDKSDKYEVRHGSKSTPLAQAVFFVETYYKSKHRTFPGTYISRVGMIVEKVKCSGMMHVNGDMTFVGPYENDGTDEDPVAAAAGTITLKYGDCCAFKRQGTLNFRVSGNTGFEQLSWKDTKEPKNEE